MLKEWELLALVQKEIDPRAFTYRGFDVWPLVRIAFCQAVYSHCTGTPHHLPSQGGTGRRIYADKSPVEKLVLFFKRIAHRALKTWEHAKLLGALRAAEPCDVVFLSREQYHSEVIEGAYYDRCVDPFIELAQGHFRYEKIEMTEAPGRLPRAYPPRFVDANLPRYRAGRRLNAPSPTGRFAQEMDRIQHFLDRQGIAAKLDGAGILCQAEEIFMYRDSFLELLRVMRPKALFCTCIVDLPSMGAVAACRELGITSVEIHHGFAGNNHGLYTHHETVPAGGFALLPDYSWMWTPEAAQAFGNWYPQGSRHRFVAGGNLWMAKCLSDKAPALTPEQSLFVKSLVSGKRVALFTGGWGEALDKTFPNPLIEAMRLTQDTCIWLIRLHPNYRNACDQVAAYLKQRGISSFEIEHSTHCPLHALLKVADHHVTLHSSAYFEAKLFGLHTTMTSRIAQKAFADYAEDPMLHFCREPGDIARNVLDCPREAQADSLLVRPPGEALALFSSIIEGGLAPHREHSP
jgi:hypothetical protein